MIVVVSRTIIIKGVSIPIIQNRIESECHFLIILFFFFSSKVNGIKIKRTFQFIDVDLKPMNGDIPKTHKEKRK